MQHVIRQMIQHLRFTAERKEFRRLRPTLFRRRSTSRVHPIGLGTLPPRVKMERKADPHRILVHMSHGPSSHQCVCNCPDGYCEHKWDGPPEEGDNYHSATCSRCGKSALSHDMWVF